MRVTTASTTRLAGDLASLGDSDLALRLDATHSERFPRRDVRRIEISGGTHGNVPSLVVEALAGGRLGLGASWAF